MNEWELTVLRTGAIDKKPHKNNYWAGLVIHHTGNVAKDDKPSTWAKITSGVISWLTAADTNYVSAHFVIDRLGYITMLVNPDQDAAYHAGVSMWLDPVCAKFRENCNDFMLGIELVGDGNVVAYTSEQISACAKLSAYLSNKYGFLVKQIVGHQDISPGRKVDPGKFFPWEEFYCKVIKYKAMPITLKIV